MRLTKFNKQQQKFLLLAPIVVLPFLCIVFIILGGGKDVGKKEAKKMGLNPELPAAWADVKSAFRNKYQQYQKADQDSLKKKAWQRQDPYQQDSASGHVADTPRRPTYATLAQPALKMNNRYEDPKATELLKQLSRLQESLHQPPAVNRPLTPPAYPSVYRAPVHRPDTTQDNPSLDRLNTMLDKVIRIQHPEEGRPTTKEEAVLATDVVLPTDPDANAIAAVVPNKQTLTNGATIALRVTDGMTVNGVLIPPGQLVYGLVGVSGDRLTVHIGAITRDRNLYNTDLQVFDVDGLAGIHIPGTIDRDVAKQSADQGVSSMNIATLDPSLGAQAANASIQAAKTLLSRKVRLVRVTVPAGYRVLLRPAKASARRALSTSASAIPIPQPPDAVPGGAAIQHCRTEGVELALQGIWLKDTVLWFALRWKDRSPILFVPEYVRWFIRDCRVLKRTAIQELALEPLYSTKLPVVGDSTSSTWTGFQPFALGPDKELVLEAGEKGGGRVLTLVIHHKQLLKAKIYGKETGDQADGKTADPIH